MHYGHNNEKRHFFIDGIQFHESDTERDFGVIFATNLGFDCNKQSESDAK